ncbi:MAG TPA: hypothetical protein DEP28_06120 [Bacteroidetes bacterium]|nr:hypothetical protein [Bacteroidota bacterium]HCN37557.1 hypothetical protein [Bacteroidota bacterium]
MANSKFLFRIHRPKRTYKGEEFSNYRKYKDFLAKDFNSRCGYTDCLDFWFGGKRSFHIDHFKPHSKYPQLKTVYSNLVYVSSYVNIAKSDDDGDYIDPCETNYNDHFYRDKSGNIHAEEDSKCAVYMYNKLKLYLKRYGIIWMLEQLEEKMETLKVLIQKSDNNEAKELFIEVTFEYMKYKKYLRINQ